MHSETLATYLFDSLLRKKRWRTTSTFNFLNNFKMTYFQNFKKIKKEEIDIERAVKQITLARGGANAPPLANIGSATDVG